MSKHRFSAKQLALRALAEISLYLPMLIMTGLAVGSFWLLRISPSSTELGSSVSAKPSDALDYLMHSASIRSFDAQGVLTADVHGKYIEHAPSGLLNVSYASAMLRRADAVPSAGSAKDTGADANAATPYHSSYNVHANLLRGNADLSEVQLFGDAALISKRDGAADASLKGEYLHLFLDENRVSSNRPTLFQRGSDVFSADSMTLDQMQQTLDMQGHVRITLAPPAPLTPLTPSAPPTSTAPKP